MEKRSDSLLFKFGIIFLVFTVITLALSGLMTYFSQLSAHRKQSEENIRNIGEYLERLIQAEGEDFATYQAYYMAHFAEVDIPFDFSEYRTAQAEYERLFAANYPGRTLGKDIRFEELSDEVKKAWFIYRHEYWLLTFEEARAAFHIPYTYYLVPKEDIYYMVYMIDGERTAKKDSNGKILYLGDEYYDAPEKYPVQWEAWFSGKRPNGFQVWDNEWGHTYAYYTPLIINGKKLGLIGTEIEVRTVNDAILRNTMQQIAAIALVLVLCVAALLWFIYQRHIARLSRLQASVRTYAAAKDATIATAIEQESNGRDEISSLAMQMAAMILEMENYMKSLLETTKELTDTKEQAARLSALANKDALTGIRNKTAYDNELRKLAWEMDEGLKEFGIAMIDLNFLKRINDTYGHEQGNVAIRKLCRLVCVTFAHSPVFRIGGDEFVAILKNTDYQNIDVLVESFNQELAKMATDDSLEPWEKISAALGYALYNPSADSSVENVFKRADKAMYARKMEMKAVRTS